MKPWYDIATEKQIMEARELEDCHFWYFYGR